MEFVSKNARKLDFELMNYFFIHNNSNIVLNELKKFQNADGGFGYGLEPDFRTPLSSNMATTYAFQYLEKLNLAEIPHFFISALKFFKEEYSKEHKGWPSIPEGANDSPRAEWWNFDEEQLWQDVNWGNPTVEIIGYLLRYENDFDKTELTMLKQKALNRLFDAQEVEVHELMCYQRFVHALNDQEKHKVYEKICQLALDQVNRDSSQWADYVPRPLNFVDSPTSPVYGVLKNEVEMELDYLINTISEEGEWFPNWAWGQYKEEWQKVKPEVAGMVTVRNLITLKLFGRIES